MAETFGVQARHDGPEDEASAAQDAPASAGASQPPRPGQAAVDAASLCAGCGFCCTSGLFSYVSVARKDVARLKQAGFALYKKPNGRIAFDLPCPKFAPGGCAGDAGGTESGGQEVSGGCSIYADRPETCVRFRCHLMKRVMNGTVSLDAATRLVALVKQQHRWIADTGRMLLDAGPGPFNVLNFLHEYAHRAEVITARGRLTPADRKFTARIFEHLKLIDREFREIELLPRFAGLLQSAHAAEQDAPRDTPDSESMAGAD